MGKDGSVNSGDEGAAFENLVGLLDYPMFVVTTTAVGQRAGCLVGFATQVSIRPRRFLVGLSNKNHTYRVGRDASHLAVHLLSSEHTELARLFGEQTGDTSDKFAQCAYHDGPHGVPILDDAAAWFSGRILEQLTLGDRVAFLLQPEAGHAPEQLRSLVSFGDVHDLDPGHAA